MCRGARSALTFLAKPWTRCRPFHKQAGRPACQVRVRRRGIIWRHRESCSATHQPRHLGKLHQYGYGWARACRRMRLTRSAHCDTWTAFPVQRCCGSCYLIVSGCDVQLNGAAFPAVAFSWPRDAPRLLLKVAWRRSVSRHIARPVTLRCLLASTIQPSREADTRRSGHYRTRKPAPRGSLRSLNRGRLKLHDQPLWRRDSIHTSDASRRSTRPGSVTASRSRRQRDRQASECAALGSGRVRGTPPPLGAFRSGSIDLPSCLPIDRGRGASIYVSKLPLRR
jgi:hypothetical protein